MAGSPGRLDGARMSHSAGQGPRRPPPLCPQGTVAEGCARIGRVEEAMWDRWEVDPWPGVRLDELQDPFQPKLFHESVTQGGPHTAVDQ